MHGSTTTVNLESGYCRSAPRGRAVDLGRLLLLSREREQQRGREKVAAGMVLGAVIQFIKRLCILIVGLLRLSYRKVRTPERGLVYGHRLRVAGSVRVRLAGN